MLTISTSKFSYVVHSLCIKLRLFYVNLMLIFQILFFRKLIKPLNGENTTAQSVFVDRAESVMHDMFGGKDYWDARRSMVFAAELQKEAAEFRAKYLDSDDERDNTHRPSKWKTPKVS